MRFVRFVAILAGALALLCLVPFTAAADNTTCDNATWITPDGSVLEGTFAAQEFRWFRFTGKTDRSYALMNEFPNPDGTTGGGITPPEGPCGSTVVAAGGTVTSTTFQEPTAYANTAPGRYSIKVAANQTVYFGIFGPAAGMQYRIRVEDTTQINTFFSTYSGFNTFYRFTNTTNQSVSVTLKLVSDAGTVVASETFTVSANRAAPTRNTSAADLNVPANTAGFAVITHLGTPGAIAADAFLSGTGGVLPLRIVNARQPR